MRICVKRYLYRSRVIEQLIEDWKTQQIDCRPNTFLTAIVPECIDVGEYCRQSWEYLHELLLTEPNGDEINKVGKIMKLELPRTLAAFNWTQELVAGAHRIGAMSKDAGAFEAAAKQIREVNAKIELVFPVLNEAMAEASREAFLRGECIPIEDFIRDTQGSSVPAGHGIL